MLDQSDVVIEPYRTPGIVKAEKPKPMFGLIRVPKIKDHKCSPPSIFWYWLTFRVIGVGSVWRCKCGDVYRCRGSEWNKEGYNPQLIWEDKGGIY